MTRVFAVLALLAISMSVVAGEPAVAPRTHYRTVPVDGRTIFYRESGDASAPVVILLHGFPGSSFAYRELIPLLADRYHVIAPDLPGFGYSDSPPRSEYTYTFDNLTIAIDHFTQALGLKRSHQDGLGAPERGEPRRASEAQAKGDNTEVQTDLLTNFATEHEMYPKYQEYFRKYQPPLLAVWGKNDPFFLWQAAEAFKRDLPKAEVHLYPTSHFALETHVGPIAAEIRRFLARTLPTQKSAK
jgi:pimeloyl-ACP methyl ester carboxylesterase